MNLKEWQKQQFKKGILKGGFIRKEGIDWQKELENQVDFIKKSENVKTTQETTQAGPPLIDVNENPFKTPIRTKRTGIVGLKKWYTGNLKIIKVRVPTFIYVLMKRISGGMQISMSELVRSILINRFSEMFK
jgi:hypothetical protein